MKVVRKVLIPVEDESQICIDDHHYGVSIMQVNTVYKSKINVGLLRQYSEEVALDTMGISSGQAKTRGKHGQSRP